MVLWAVVLCAVVLRARVLWAMVLRAVCCGEYLVNIDKVGGPLSSGGPEGDGDGLSLVTYWPNK